MILVLARALVAALSLSLWLESVGNDLGAGESLGGGAVPVPLVGPVGLPHHEPQLLHPGLHLPLLYVSPSHLEKIWFGNKAGIEKMRKAIWRNSPTKRILMMKTPYPLLAMLSRFIIV